jgi:ABC-2 type transport system ATP-binding protein
MPTVAPRQRHPGHHAQDGRELSVPVTDRLAALTQIIGSLQEQDITAEDITVRRPTLNDAFLHLTGQRPPPDRAALATEAARP